MGLPTNYTRVQLKMHNKEVLLHKENGENSLKRNWAFATNSDFEIPISLKRDFKQ